jgi:hypothetical protein
MTLTLWRGRELLGEFHPRAPRSGDQIEGVLLVSPTSPPLASLVQGHVSLQSGSIVMERSMEDVAGMAQSRQSINPGPIALQPRPPGEPLGIPVDRQLHVEDEMGQSVPIANIMILEHRPDPSAPNVELATLPASALRNGSVWLVTMRLGAGAHAT